MSNLVRHQNLCRVSTLTDSRTIRLRVKIDFVVHSPAEAFGRLCDSTLWLELRSHNLGGAFLQSSVHQDKLFKRGGICFHEQKEGGRRSRRVNLGICRYLTTVAVFADGYKIWNHGGDAFLDLQEESKKKISASMCQYSSYGISSMGSGWGQQFLQWKSNSSSSIRLYHLLSFCGWQPVVAINRAQKL